MIVLFSHHLQNEFQLGGLDDVEIYATANVSLNGRPYQLLIDPEVDLTKVSRSLLPYSWILPLDTPLEGALDTALPNN